MSTLSYAIMYFQLPSYLSVLSIPGKAKSVWRDQLEEMVRVKVEKKENYYPVLPDQSCKGLGKTL